MLVTFTTNAYADITMFGNIALAMLKMMGQSGTVPGTILVRYVHGASCRLYHRVSDELVVGIPAHEARRDDGATVKRVCRS